jgi:6-phosphofructokinase 1
MLGLGPCVQIYGNERISHLCTNIFLYVYVDFDTRLSALTTTTTATTLPLSRSTHCLLQQTNRENVFNKGSTDDISSPKKGRTLAKDISYLNLKGPEDCILADIVRHPRQTTESRAYLRAGPREVLWFNPKSVRAAIITCGGLCPGLNNIIRELTLSLVTLYGATNVIGIRNGYLGFHDGSIPLQLNEETVAGIQHKGGTILRSARGGFGPGDEVKIVEYLQRHNINQLYIIGGDGTHRGAQKLYTYIREKKLDICIACIPKTIDNDLDLIDRSFGFNTSVAEAQRSILSAKVEAKCAPNGVGLVKLMGRHAGYIASHATLASGDVDLCLIPEVPIVLNTEDGKGCLDHVERCIAKQGHVVIVVAEGAGEELLGKNAEVDAGGNRKLPEIIPFLKKKIVDHFKSKGQECNFKYLDPSYMIRSVPADAGDSLYCMLLAQNAVHGAMAGFTGFTVGLTNNRTVFLPITAIVRNSPRLMDPVGRTWERVLSVTGQPDTTNYLSDKVKQAIKDKERQDKTIF